jgi:lysophospholipase L1-like esterase
MSHAVLLLVLLLTLAGEPVKAKEISILALGDSYTIGEAVTTASRWPNQLRNLLANHGISANNPVIVARTGWTTANLASAIKSRSIHTHFDIVTLLIGVNDQFQGYSANDYRPAFRALLKTAIGFAADRPAHVIVLSIPDYSVTPFAKRYNQARIASELAEFNNINKNLSLEEGVHYINITAMSQQAAQRRDLIAYDGLHPSELMYHLWAEKILPVIQQILDESNGDQS